MTSPLSPEAVAQMVADREAGTPGPWRMRVNKRDDQDTCDVSICGDIFVLADLNGPQYAHQHANARRIARLPDLEAAYLTLAAENATLRSENDIWTERSTDAELNWANCTRLAQRLRASEAAALERVKVLTDALKETYDNLFYQLEAKRGPQFASEYPSIRRAEKALTPTADKEPTT